jgi:chorismate dehydratase
MDNLDQNPVTARIGMVNFINTAPLYEKWQQLVKRPDWRITEAPPTTLNRMLYNNELDLGFVSSHEYAAHPHLYRLLRGLSISATGPVGSVFLFSKKDPEMLSGKTVLLSSLSQTSVSLVKIILEEYYQVIPNYMSGILTLDGKLPQCAQEKDIQAVLAIGDNALRLRESDLYTVKLDLSEVWQKKTGLPFVFAVWAVREEFCQKDPDSISQIQHQLLRCIEEGKRDLQSICQIVAPRIPMKEKDCFDYLCGMEYDLDANKLKALEVFFDYLIKRGEVPAEALPVKFV